MSKRPKVETLTGPGPGRLLFICEFCGKEFWRTERYVREGGKGRFCGRSCGGKAIVEKRRSDLVTVEAVCKCGKAFSYQTPVSGLGANKGKVKKVTKYCSLQCSYKNNGRNVKKERNPRWKGGMSPYPLTWTEEFRTAIRIRDGRVCTICKQYRRLDVHHIDWDKQNTTPENCISLCRVCHPKVHAPKRAETWKVLLSVAAKLRVAEGMTG